MGYHSMAALSWLLIPPLCPLLATTRQSAGEKRTCAAEEGRAGVETSVGGRCWHVQQHVLSLVHSWRCPGVLTATPPASTRSWESVVFAGLEAA